LSPSPALILRKHRDEEINAHVLLEKTLTDEGYVFFHSEGTQLDTSTVSHAFSRILRQADLPCMHLYRLSHNHATFLLQAGVYPLVAMEKLGNSSICMTLYTYSHIIGGLQECSARRFDDFVSAKGADGEHVGIIIVKEDRGRQWHDKIRIGVRGFEPPTT